MVLGKRALDLAPGLHCPRSPFFRSCMWQYSWSNIICWPYSPYNTLLYTCRKSPGSVTGGKGGGGGAGRARGRACHAFSTLCPSWHGLRCVEAKNVSQQVPHAHSVKVTRGSTPTRRPSDCASLDARTPGLQARHTRRKPWGETFLTPTRPEPWQQLACTPLRHTWARRHRHRSRAER